MLWSDILNVLKNLSRYVFLQKMFVLLFWFLGLYYFQFIVQICELIIQLVVTNRVRTRTQPKSELKGKFNQDFLISSQIFGIFDKFSKWNVPISPWHG